MRLTSAAIWLTLGGLPARGRPKPWAASAIRRARARLNVRLDPDRLSASNPASAADDR